MNSSNRFLPLLLMLALGPAGCDKDLLAGGYGEVEATATDKPPQQANASLSPRPGGSLGPDGGPSAQVVPQIIEGSVEIQVTMTLVHTSGDEVTVLETPVTATVGIGANQPVPLGSRREVPRGRYTIARVSFTSVRATLTAGPGVIGTRVVDVDLDGQPGSVERLLNLVVGVTELERLEIDLNASTWLLLEQSGLVDFADFAEAIRIQVVT